MGKKNKQSPVNETIVIEGAKATEKKELIITEKSNDFDVVINDEIVEESPTIASSEEGEKEKKEKKEVQEDSLVQEKKIQDKPKKKTSKRQGVVVETGLASVVVVDLKGNRFRLIGIKGNVGDTVEF